MDQIDYGSTELADASSDIIESFKLDSQPLAQPQEILRAATVVMKDRGNRRRKVAFTVLRAPKASAAAARQSIISHDLALETRAEAGQTTITHAVGGQSITYSDVVVTHAAQQIGLTVRHSYAITFGALAIA